MYVKGIIVNDRVGAWTRIVKLLEKLFEGNSKLGIAAGVGAWIVFAEVKLEDPSCSALGTFHNLIDNSQLT